MSDESNWDSNFEAGVTQVEMRSYRHFDVFRKGSNGATATIFHCFEDTVTGQVAVLATDEISLPLDAEAFAAQRLRVAQLFLEKDPAADGGGLYSDVNDAIANYAG